MSVIGGRRVGRRSEGHTKKVNERQEQLLIQTLRYLYITYV